MKDRELPKRTDVILAAGILAVSDPDLGTRLDAWRDALSASVAEEPVDE